MRNELDHDVEGVIPALFHPAEPEKMPLVASRDASRRTCWAAFLDPGLNERRADDRLKSHLRPPCAPSSGQEPPDNLNGRINVRRHRHRITKHMTKLSIRPRTSATRPRSPRLPRELLGRLTQDVAFLGKLASLGLQHRVLGLQPGDPCCL